MIDMTVVISVMLAILLADVVKYLIQTLGYILYK